MATILFLHGWQSTPGGVKPTYLKDHGNTVLNPALPDDDFAEAIRIAQAEFDSGKPDVVVGSSRGGAVAMNIDAGSVPLVLLCPAWKRWGTAVKVKLGTVILHSRNDEIVPFADSKELVNNSGLPSNSLIDVGTDHRLANPESLAKMLEVVERTGTFGRQFTVGTLLVITTVYAILFGAMRAFGFPLPAFLGVTVFLTAVSLGQVFLFKGNRPGNASVIVGGCFLSCYVLLAGIADPGTRPRLTSGDICWFSLIAFIPGAAIGYIGGTLTRWLFLILNHCRSLLNTGEP